MPPSKQKAPRGIAAGKKKPADAPVYDLWGGEGETAVARTPQPVQTSDKWYISPESVKQATEQARRRKVAVVKPNKRDAVSLPAAGQSYNPEDDEHQSSLARAARQLQKKRTRDEQFQRRMALTSKGTYKGDVKSDRMWEEESVADAAAARAAAAAERKGPTPEQAQSAARERAKKEVKAKKLGKLGRLQEERRSRGHARHPDRKAVLDQIEHIDKIAAEVDAANKKKIRRLAKRMVAKTEGQLVPKFGRYVHQPMSLDVATSGQLSGALRTMGTTRISAVQERMKSLEERGLVPARMRHKFHTKSQFKPKGEVKIKTEEFGWMPE